MVSLVDKIKPLRFVYLFTLAAVMFLAAIFTFSSLPLPGNYRIMVVLSGSMNPFIKLGSLVLVKPLTDYQVGEVVTYKNPKDPGKTTTHRIVEKKTAEGGLAYTTKGDTNNSPDAEPVPAENIVGKMLFSLPLLGYAVVAVKKPVGFFFLILLPATMIIYDELRKIKDEVKKMRAKTAVVALFFFSLSFVSVSGMTNAFFSDTETSSGNLFQVTSWDTWVQTSQSDFDAGSLSNIDTSTATDSARLTGAYQKDGNTVALWHMNEGSGSTVQDSGDNHNDGTINGATWASGKYAGGLDFDGTDDYVNVPDSSSLDITSQITVEAWIRADNWDNPGPPYNVRNVLDKGEHKTQKAYGLYSYNGKFHFRVNATTRCDAFGDLPSTGVWHHVAGTYDGTSVKVYVDNTKIGEVDCSGNIQTNDESLYIGGGVDRAYWFDGVIDEVRISNTARLSFPVSYFSPGTLESQPFNGGGPREWDNLAWDEDVSPSGTDITLEVATSDDGSNWTWWPASFGSSPVDLAGLPLPNSQYFKWKATLTTSDPGATPVLHEVRVKHFSP